MNRKIVVGMLRQGQVGSQILDILNVIVDDIRESICDAQGIANCPENEDEIRAMMILNWIPLIVLTVLYKHLSAIVMMNRQIVLGLLRQGRDGNSILSILDIIVEEYQQQQSNQNQPTLNPIAFWVIRIKQCENVRYHFTLFFVINLSVETILPLRDL